MHRVSAGMALVVALSILSLSSAQQVQPWTCAGPEFRQFDFWLGEWNVVDRASRTPVGRSRIEKIQDGCAIQEHWEGAAGDTGTSLNTYDPPLKAWHQVWVSNAGAFLHLEGTFQGGKMVLSGEAVRPRRGVAVLNRVTWSVVNNDPDQVSQFWETSSDGGKTWNVDFDGLYLRKK